MKLQGRLSAMRDFVLIVGIIAGIVGVISLISFSMAMKSKDGVVSVSLAELVDGEISTGSYVAVSGYALYGAYEVTEDSALVDSYYWLLDDRTGDVVVVKDDVASYLTPDPEPVSIEGMVRSMPTDLRTLVREDQAEYTDVRLSDSVYIAEGDTPPNLNSSLLLMLIGLGLGVVSVAYYIVIPDTVFMTRAPAAGSQFTQERPSVLATGQFRKLKAMDPLTWSPGKMKFKNSVANLVPVNGGQLMLYIHQIVRSRVYGVQVNKTETDWGLLLTADNVHQVQCGALLGMHERPALRVAYYNDRRKLQEAFIIFNDENGLYTGQAWFAKLGFTVETGETL